MTHHGIEQSASASGPFRSWAATHPGPIRRCNEDCFVNRPDLGVWAVADGAGGHEDGQLAARSVASCLDALPPGLPQRPDHVRSVLGELHVALHQQARHRSPASIVASTVVALLARKGGFTCLWAGDSRLYLWRRGALAQLTRDHSLVQELLSLGRIVAAEVENHPQANAVTRAVGAGTVLELDGVDGRLLPGDRLLLCSDGLSRILVDPCLAALLGETCEQPAERLTQTALDRGATDNVTAVVVDVLP